MGMDTKKSKSVEVKEKKSIDEKPKECKPMTKVVARRLPPKLTKDEFIDTVGPLADYDYFHYVEGDPLLEPHSFSRAYINFLEEDEVFNFCNKFDGYVFVHKGNEYPAIVEFAPYQKIPKLQSKSKKDLKSGTIDQDPDYLAFLESLDHPDTSSLINPETYIEELDNKEKEAKNKETTTPLLEFIRDKKAEKARMREERRDSRKKREDERRKAREEERKRRKENKEKAFLEMMKEKSGQTRERYRYEDDIVDSSSNVSRADEDRDSNYRDDKGSERDSYQTDRHHEKEKEKLKRRDEEKPRKRDRQRSDRGKRERKDPSDQSTKERRNIGDNDEDSEQKKREDTEKDREEVDDETRQRKDRERAERERERAEKRIKNKERPALEIYRPGMGKFSSQRLQSGETPRPDSPLNEKADAGKSESVKRSNNRGQGRDDNGHRSSGRREQQGRRRENNPESGKKDETQENSTKEDDKSGTKEERQDNKSGSREEKPGSRSGFKESRAGNRDDKQRVKSGSKPSNPDDKLEDKSRHKSGGGLAGQSRRERKQDPKYRDEVGEDSKPRDRKPEPKYRGDENSESSRTRDRKPDSKYRDEVSEGSRNRKPEPKYRDDGTEESKTRDEKWNRGKEGRNRNRDDRVSAREPKASSVPKDDPVMKTETVRGGREEDGGGAAKLQPANTSKVDRPASAKGGADKDGAGVYHEDVVFNLDPKKESERKSGKSYLSKRRERQQEREEKAAKEQE